MIPKREIIESFTGEKVGDMTVGAISLQLRPQIAELSIRLGEHKTDNFIFDTSNLFAKTIQNDYSRLYLLEVILAVDFCGRGLTIEIKGVSVMSLISALKFYLTSEERRTAKGEFENKAIALLPEKTGWTNEEHLNAMRKRYRENLARLRNGSKVSDVGGLLFEHLQKLEMVEITQEDFDAITDDLIRKKKNNPFDIEVRRALNSEEIKKILARENALTKYFELEIAMRNEYEKLKSNGNFN